MLSVGKLKWEFWFPVLRQKHFITAETLHTRAVCPNSEQTRREILKFIFSSSTTLGLSANLAPLNNTSTPCSTSEWFSHLFSWSNKLINCLTFSYTDLQNSSPSLHTQAANSHGALTEHGWSFCPKHPLSGKKKGAEVEGEVCPSKDCQENYRFDSTIP